MTDDAELLRGYAATRSEEAFADLVRQHVDLGDELRRQQRHHRG